MLKFAISTEEDEVCPNFERAHEITIIKIEKNKLIEKNVLSKPKHIRGNLPEFLNEQGTKSIVTGEMNYNTLDLFIQKGIDVILGVHGKTVEVIEQILDGTIGEAVDFNPIILKSINGY